MSAPRATNTGYTLIELLVVIALIAVLTAAVGLGLRGANGASALTATQEMVRAQIDAVRARASLNGRPAALALFADATEPARHLREIGIAEQNEAGEWALTADPLTVPGEVQFMAPADGATAWSDPVTVGWDAAGGSSPAYLVRFTPTGTLAEAGGGEIWWSAADQTGRVGLIISRYGAVVAIETPVASEGDGS